MNDILDSLARSLAADAARSQTAITKIVRQLGTLGGLQSAFREAGSKAKITSCSATANIVMDKISDKPISAGRNSVFVKPGMFNFWSNGQSMLMSVEAMVNEIVGLLDQPVAICISIKRDHHFVVLPIDDSRIAMLQGFQDSYSLADWIEWCGVGSQKKTEFEKALLDLLASNEKPTWTAAAVKLFSFESSWRSPGNSTVSKAEIKQDIEEWFGDKPYIVSYAYRKL